MDWILGRSSKKSSPPPAPSPAPTPIEPPPPPMFEAPDIDNILSHHDPARLHPLANLDKQTLDYIILEDEQIKSQGALPSRGWTDDLCYGTGATYLTALGMGGAWGIIEALQKPRQNLQAHNILNPQATIIGDLGTTARVAAGAPGLGAASAAGTQATRQSGKLILNNILNHVTRRGPYLGNSAGVLAMSYNLLNAGLDSWTPIPQSATPLLSGFIAGAMFRSTAGLRASAITGTLVMGAAAAWQGVKRNLI